MAREKLVVIGNGMAGCRAVEEILKRDPDRYDIAIFGAEPRVNYNRIMLSPVLAGEKAFADIVINDEAWYRDNAITLHGGRAGVIGGGLLGLEAAYGLARRGMAATVVHLMDVLMERQLDESAGFLLRQALADRGVETVLGAQSEEIVGEGGKVAGLKLKDGSILPCDLLVMAVGIRPNAALGKAAGLEVNRGLVVDDAMRTSDPAVFAGGESAEHRGQCYGLVAPIWEMCRALAEALTDGEGAYEGSVLSTRLKVSGVDVFSAGRFAGGDGCEDIVFRDAARGG